MGGPDRYKALADPTRRQILKLLRDGDLPAGAIADQFDMSWPSVSRHLSVLVGAGLIEGTRRGQQLVYSLTTSVLADIVTELIDMTGLNQPSTRPARRTARRKVPVGSKGGQGNGPNQDGRVAGRGERGIGLGGLGVS